MRGSICLKTVIPRAVNGSVAKHPDFARRPGVQFPEPKVGRATTPAPGDLTPSSSLCGVPT